MSRFLAKARANAKLDYCYVCNNPCTSFCNSHSIPQFVLKRVANEGKISPLLQDEIPLQSSDVGVKKAGTFHLICRDCDSKLFQDYENPEAYLGKPTSKMLGQIVLKNYLQLISKRLDERELYILMGKYNANYLDFAEDKILAGDLDLAGYVENYKRSLNAASGGSKDSYYLCYYASLDYVVPYAAQAAIVMVSDFDGNVINDVYNFSPDYKTKDIHIAIFPLKTKSVVMLIVDSKDRRYRKFYRQLNKLPLNDQLAAINYIIFSYSENIFLSKSIDESVIKNPYFLDTCKKTIDIESPTYFKNGINIAVQEHSLSKRNEIPNLLSKEFALSE